MAFQGHSRSNVVVQFDSSGCMISWEFSNSICSNLADLRLQIYNFIPNFPLHYAKLSCFRTTEVKHSWQPANSNAYRIYAVYAADGGINGDLWITSQVNLAMWCAW